MGGDRTIDHARHHATGRAVAAYTVLTVFICGAAVMLIEILAARVIAPFFGSSVFVWTAVISVTLLSLALGYALGGRAADRARPADLLYGALALAAAYLLVALLVKRPVLTLGMQWGLRTGALFSSAVLFAFPLFLLGTVAPLAVKLYASNLQRIGSDVGVLYFFSTAGSFLGTLLAGFVLLPVFSVSRIILFCAFLLLVLSAVYFAAARRLPGYLLLLAACLSLGLPLGRGERLSASMIAGTPWQELYKKDGFYARLKVIEVGSAGRYLVADGINQGGLSIIDGSAQVPYAYVVDILGRTCAPGMKRALVIGLGPGVVPDVLSARGVSVDAVEIDPQVADVYGKYFAAFAKGEETRVFIEDGRCFIKRRQAVYDCIVLDVFLGDSSPWHLLTREAFQEMKALLSGGGALVINFVGLPSEASEARIIGAIHRTLGEVFPYAAVFNRGRSRPHEAQNVFFLASMREPPGYFSEEVLVPPLLQAEVLGALGDRQEQAAQDAFLLTDEYNPVDFYTARTKEAWRKAIMNSPEQEIMLD